MNSNCDLIMNNANCFCKCRNATIDKSFTVLVGIILLFNTAFSDVKMCSYSSLACITFYYLVLFATRPIVYFRYLHFFFASFAGIVGCSIIEFCDIELYEISDASSFQGSLPLLIFTWWVLLATLAINDERLNKKLSINENYKIMRLKDNFSIDSKGINFSMLLAAVVGCCLIVFTFLTVANNPSFLLGMDRFEYAKEYDYGLLYDQAKRFIRYLIIPCIVVAVYKKSKIGWGALVFYGLHAFWVGEKFGSFFSLLCTITMIYSQKIANQTKRLKKLLFVIAIVTVALIGMAVFAVSFTRNEGASNYFLPRAAQQSQLWWKTYSTSKSYHLNEFGDELKTIYNGKTTIADNVGSQYGIYKIMYYTTPKTQADAKLNSGARYTEAGFAAAYYYLGISGCVLFAVVGGVLTSTFVNHFLFFLRYSQYVRAFIHLRFYTNMTVLISMFIFFPFFNKTSILSYIILLIGYNKVFRYGNEQV